MIKPIILHYIVRTVIIEFKYQTYMNIYNMVFYFSFHKKDKLGMTLTNKGTLPHNSMFLKSTLYRQTFPLFMSAVSISF